MRKFVWMLVGVLFVLHQDFWWWDDRSLVFGFMPIGLFYHMVFSLAAAGVWVLAVKCAWPSHIEEWADRTSDDDASTARAPTPTRPGDSTAG